VGPTLQFLLPVRYGLKLKKSRLKKSIQKRILLTTNQLITTASINDLIEAFLQKRLEHL
jgi:hypothetical protein